MEKLEKHTNRINCLSKITFQDKTLVFSGSNDKSICIWNANTRTLMKQIFLKDCVTYILPLSNNLLWTVSEDSILSELQVMQDSETSHGNSSDEEVIFHLTEPKEDYSLTVRRRIEDVCFFFFLLTSKLLTEKQTQMELTRSRILKELLDTERTYVFQLTVLKDVNFFFLKSHSAGLIFVFLQFCFQSYMAPMLKQNLISQDQVSKLFGNVTLLHKIHVVFLGQLENAMKNYNSEKSLISSIFLQVVDALKLYTDYINNHSDATALCDKLKSTSKKFAKFLNETELKGPLQLDLYSILIVPVQRFERKKS